MEALMDPIDLPKDEEVVEDTAKHSWSLDRKISPSWLWTVGGALLFGVWWVSNLSLTQNQHTLQLNAMQTTIQTLVSVESKVDVLSTQLSQIAASVALLADANRRITTLENNTAELRIEFNSVVTHEQRLGTLEHENAEFIRTINDITQRLVRIETKVDSLGNTDSGVGRSNKRN